MQRRQHFADDGAVAIERFADASFVFIERLDAGFGGDDLAFDAAQAAGGVDQILVELAAVGAELFDLALERGFVLGRLALRLARGIEFVVALLDGVEFFIGRLCDDLSDHLRLLRQSQRRTRHRDRRDHRGASVEMARSANHPSQITPVRFHSKIIRYSMPVD